MKTGVVFEGGAFRTIFSCGVIDALLDKDIFPDYMIGVSAGAGYGVSYASRQNKRNVKIIMRYCNDPRYLSNKNILDKNNRSIFGLDFVYNTVPNKLVLFDYDTYDKFPGGFLCAMTNVETGKTEYKPYLSEDKEMHVLRATCALPLAFPKIELDGVPYMDGGITDPVPFQKALDDGCDRVLVVATREAGYRKKPDKKMGMIAKLYNKYPAFQAALEGFTQTYNAQMDMMDEYEKEGIIKVLRPGNTAGIKMMDKDKRKLLALYNEGYNQTMRRSRELEEFFGGK